MIISLPFRNPNRFCAVALAHDYYVTFALRVLIS